MNFYKVFPYPLPLAALTICLWREWAGITLQLNLSKVKPCALRVLEGSLPNPGAISPVQPTRPFGTESFPGPSQLHSTHGLWEVSGFCSPSQKPPWGLCFSREKSSHWPPQSRWNWASRPERWGPTLGALMAGCQNSPFKAPFLLLLLLLPFRSV